MCLGGGRSRLYAGAKALCYHYWFSVELWSAGPQIVVQQSAMPDSTTPIACMHSPDS